MSSIRRSCFLEMSETVCQKNHNGSDLIDLSTGIIDSGILGNTATDLSKITLFI